MLKPRLLVFWVSATVALVVLLPFIFALLSMVSPIDGIHDGEI
jgi:hypothetical protein